MAGHFAISHLYATLSLSWWWEGMYNDVYKFCCGCPQPAITTGGGRKSKPLLHPIPFTKVLPNYWGRCSGITQD